MTEAMPFLQKTILLSYDPRSLPQALLFCRYSIDDVEISLISTTVQST